TRRAEREDGMKQSWKRSITWALVGAVVVTLVLASAGVFTARAADPIKIGFGMALTGGLSANGKPALLAMQIWKDDVNKKGGLLGRPVELVYYDDQTDPATSTATGFFELAAKQNPRPQTVALVGADAEYPQTALVGARELVKRHGFKTVYDKTYPPSTVDYTPIVRAIKALNPDVLFVA